MIWHGNSTEKRPGPGLIKTVKNREYFCRGGADPRQRTPNEPRKTAVFCKQDTAKLALFCQGRHSGNEPRYSLLLAAPGKAAEIRRKPQKKGGLHPCKGWGQGPKIRDKNRKTVNIV
jgi:hypothetical protein